MKPRMSSRRSSLRYRRLSHSLDDDPLAAVANLFDVAMMFAVAMVFALFAASRLPGLLATSERATGAAKAGKPDLAVVAPNAARIDRFRMTNESAGGTGRRLGVAYLLASGEVVYVPEPPSR